MFGIGSQAMVLDKNRLTTLREGEKEMQTKKQEEFLSACKEIHTTHGGEKHPKTISKEEIPQLYNRRQRLFISWIEQFNFFHSPIYFK